jgi:hypothetical protein
LKKIRNHVKKIINEEKLKLRQSDIDKIILNSNNSLNCIFHYCEKIKLLNVTKGLDNKFFNLIDNEIFDSYFIECNKNDIYKGYCILKELLDKGYMLIDIYDELYEYCKKKNKKYILIELLCKFIDKFYDGHDKSLELYFLTNEIIKIIENKEYI